MTSQLCWRTDTNLEQFLTSKVATPKPFKPKHLRQFSDAEIEALEKLNLHGSPGSPLRQASSADPDTPTMMGMDSSVDSLMSRSITLEDLVNEATSESREGGKVNGHS